MNVAFDGPSTFDATFDPDSDFDDDSPFEGDSVVFNNPAALPTASIFDPDQRSGSHIFHSDDEAAEAGEDEGEFTGRFTFYNTPVKQDPPSSALRVEGTEGQLVRAVAALRARAPFSTAICRGFAGQ